MEMLFVILFKHTSNYMEYCLVLIIILLEKTLDLKILVIVGSGSNRTTIAIPNYIAMTTS